MEVKMCIIPCEAIIWHKKGNKKYYHREDGPAYINSIINAEDWYYYNKLYSPENMPLNLFLAYCKWEYKKKNEKTSKN